MAQLEPDLHIHDDSEYGDQKKVRDTLLKADGQSIAYLADKCEELEDSTDPEQRKRFLPILPDNDASYGMALNGGNNNYQFDDSDGAFFVDDILDLDYLDRPRTTAYVDLVNGKITTQPTRSASTVALDLNTATVFKTAGDEDSQTAKPLNTYWNIGWRKEAPFWMSTLWLQDPFSDNPATPKMQSLVRAMVFKCGVTGDLDKIQMFLHGSPRAEDEAWLEIRETDANNAPMGNDHVIYREKVNLRQFEQGGLHVVPLEHAPPLTSGEYYAISLRSPFTSYDNHYGVGGWTVYCPGTKYADGDAYTSYDNGRTFVKNGYDLDVPYEEGRFRPREFAFQTYMRVRDVNPYNSGTEYEVYWKPFKCNPIQSVVITPTFQLNGGTCTWEVSVNNRDWHEITSPGWAYDFASGALAERDQQTLYVRAKITSASTSTTPEITGLRVDVDTVGSLVGYLRTQFYCPRLSNPLGASIWSRINAPHVKNPTNDPYMHASVEIVRNTKKKEFFTTNGSDKFFMLEDKPSEPMIQILHNPASGAPVQLSENQDFVVNYYNANPRHMHNLAPLNMESGTDSDGNVGGFNDSGTGTIDLASSTSQHHQGDKSLEVDVDGTVANQGVITDAITVPANTLINTSLWIYADNDTQLAVSLTDDANNETTINVDGQNGWQRVPIALISDATTTVKIKVVTRIAQDKTFYLDEIFVWVPGAIYTTNSLATGNLQVEYYPLWMEGLEAMDFMDADGNFVGFKTDMMTEYFDGDGINDTFTLSCIPSDPIRKVEVYENGEWVEKFENLEYEMNMENLKQVIMVAGQIPASGTNNVRVKHTPYLIDTGLAIAFRCDRDIVAGKQMEIDGCYFQTRV